MATPIAFVLDDKEVQAGFARIRGQAIPQAITAAGLRAGARIAARAKAKTPVGASGLLRKSIAFKQIIVKGLPSVVVGSPLLHALVVHEGRRAGQPPPPPGALTLWLRFKGIDPKFEYIIAKRIGEKGTKAQPFLREAYDAAKADIMADYRAAFAKVFSG